MAWTDRIRENSNAADLCVAGGHYAAATTRYYYAVYQKALEAFEGRGPGAPSSRSGQPYWPHHEVGRALELLFPGAPDLDADYQLLMERRVKADYYTDGVREVTVQETARVARELRKILGGE